MFCHLNYSVDKSFLRSYFFDNFDKAKHHKTPFSEIPYWLKLFDMGGTVDSVISDLGLTGLNILPRYSFQYKNTRLYEHIDIDRIVGININLMDDHVATIHINHVPYEYECALVDVGSVLHSVESVPFDRLVLKLAIRESWSQVYSRLKSKKLIADSSCDDYISVLTEENKKFVKI